MASTINASVYAELKAACKARGITHDDIARRLDRSMDYVHKRMSGKAPWDQSDMFALLDMLREPYRKMHLYFPRNGVWAGPAEDPPPTEEERLLEALKAFTRKAAS